MSDPVKDATDRLLQGILSKQMPTPVAIIRPKMTSGEAGRAIVVALIKLFLVPYVAMLCIGAADLSWKPSYWTVWFLYVAFLFLWPTDNAYKLWSKEASK